MFRAGSKVFLSDRDAEELAVLPQAEEVSHAAETMTRPDRCPHCGRSPLPDGEIKCSSCGGSLPGASPSEEDVPWRFAEDEPKSVGAGTNGHHEKGEPIEPVWELADSAEESGFEAGPDARPPEGGPGDRSRARERRFRSRVERAKSPKSVPAVVAEPPLPMELPEQPTIEEKIRAASPKEGSGKLLSIVKAGAVLVLLTIGVVEWADKSLKLPGERERARSYPVKPRTFSVKAIPATSSPLSAASASSAGVTVPAVPPRVEIRSEGPGEIPSGTTVHFVVKIANLENREVMVSLLSYGQIEYDCRKGPYLAARGPQKWIPPGGEIDFVDLEQFERRPCPGSTVPVTGRRKLQFELWWGRERAEEINLPPDGKTSFTIEWSVMPDAKDSEPNAIGTTNTKSR